MDKIVKTMGPYARSLMPKKEASADIVVFIDKYLNINIDNEQAKVLRAILEPTERAEAEMKKLGIEL